MNSLQGSKKLWMMRIGIACVSALCSLVLLELLLEKFAPRPLDPPLEEQLAKVRRECDNLNEASMIMKIFDPLLEHSMHPNRAVFDRMDGRVCRMTTNSQGYRGPNDFELAKVPSSYRVAIQGDSFTFGEYVNDPDTYPAQLQAMLERSPIGPSGLRWQVYNFGCVSYSPLLYLQQYKLVVRNYRPDLLIIAIDNSDLQDDFYYEMGAIFDPQGKCQGFREIHPVFFMGRPRNVGYPQERVKILERRMASPTGKLMGWMKSRFQIPVYLFQSERPDSLKFGDIATDRMGHFREGVDWTGHWRRSARYLSETVRMAKSDGSRVLLLYYPYPHQINGKETPGRIGQGFALGKTYDTHLRGWIREFAESQGVPLLDAVEYFQKSGAENICFQYDQHYTPVGYRLLAEVLYKYLAEQAGDGLEQRKQLTPKAAKTISRE